jgi:transcriptional regulator with XRE-family HTH domain
MTDALNDMQLLATGDVAKQLGVSVGRVRQFEAERRLTPVFRTISGIRIFAQADVDALAAERDKLPRRRKTRAAYQPVLA